MKAPLEGVHENSTIVLTKAPKKYDDVAELIEGSERRPRVVIDGKSQVLRCHRLPQDKIQKLVKKWHETGIFVSPYSKGVYTYTLMALAKMGTNKAHDLGSILRVMKKMMEGAKGLNGLNDWERYYERRSGAANALDPKGKLWQNVRQFVRYGGLNPYGEKLRQMGVVIDRFQDDRGVRYARMNTYAYRDTEMVDGKIKIKTTAPLYIDVATVERQIDGRAVYVPEIPEVEKKAKWTLGPTTHK